MMKKKRCHLSGCPFWWKKLSQTTATKKEDRLQQRFSSSDSTVDDLPTSECPKYFGDEQTLARRGSDMKLKDTPSTAINSKLAYYKNERKSITSICIVKTTVQCIRRCHLRQRPLPSLPCLDTVFSGWEDLHFPLCLTWATRPQLPNGASHSI